MTNTELAAALRAEMTRRLSAKTSWRPNEVMMMLELGLTQAFIEASNKAVDQAASRQPVTSIDLRADLEAAVDVMFPLQSWPADKRRAK